ncbi:MAG: signal peptidase I [Candidatus Bathyarchaeum sp.]|nr:MAG: signal peptidase I [Candidatus Bathyarchaeum sp.]
MKLPEILKQDHVQTVIMIAAVIISVLVFWYGLGFVLRTGNPILAVASESMEPVLYKGDLIVIEGIEDIDDIQVGFKDAEQPGDIIIFHKPTDPDELIVHRAIEKIDKADGTYVFKTQGDNERTNRHPDPWEIGEDDIVGRYLDIKVPWLGNIALFFSTFEVKVAFIALWIVVIVIVELAPVARKKFKRGDDEESLYK